VDLHTGTIIMDIQRGIYERDADIHRGNVDIHTGNYAYSINGLLQNESLTKQVMWICQRYCRYSQELLWIFEEVLQIFRKIMQIFTEVLLIFTQMMHIFTEIMWISQRFSRVEGSNTSQ